MKHRTGTKKAMMEYCMNNVRFVVQTWNNGIGTWTQMQKTIREYEQETGNQCPVWRINSGEFIVLEGLYAQQMDQ